MKHRLLVLFVLLFSIFLSACAPVVDKRADGKMWETAVKLMEYKRVKTGSVKVGSVPVPIYGMRWREVDIATNSGFDDQPELPPQKFDCLKDVPAEPEAGDQYCETVPTKYFLIFGGLKVEVDYTTWDSHTPDKIYKTQERFGGGLIIVP